MHEVVLWKAIRRLGEFINSRVSFSIGNGRRVKFERIFNIGVSL